MRLGALYSDEPQHHQNAVLRLLNLGEAEFEEWVSLAAQGEGDILGRLRDSWKVIRPPIEPPAQADIDSVTRLRMGRGNDRVGGVWVPAIADDVTVGFAVDPDAKLAWLVRWSGCSWKREAEPPEYEEPYFEGPRHTGGYTDYRLERVWRMEKARRQVEEIGRIAPDLEGAVLEVGPGYGYFRQALAEAGFESCGVEVSKFARAVAREEFGQETLLGPLDRYVGQWSETFGLVAAFDLIEHLADPIKFLLDVHDILQPGGLFWVKTPNIDCPEAWLFREYYHSLKREHLLLFSPSSLVETARRAGLEPVRIATISHLLQGFVGRTTCEQWAASGRGSDIVAWFRRPEEG